jgi:hypothetical protein
MIAWKGRVWVKQRPRGWRLDDVAVKCRFEIFDDEQEPPIVFASMTVTDTWPLAAMRGKTIGELATLVLDEGLVHVLEFPGQPNVEGEPDPPPLRPLGQTFFEEWNDSHRLLELLLPWEFGPR